MKRTILFVIGQLGFGGGEKQLYLLIRDLDKSIYEPVVITFNDRSGDFWENQITALNTRLIRIKRFRFGFLRVVYFWFKMAKVNPDVVVSWSLYLNFVSAFFARFFLWRPAISSIRCDLFNNTTPKIKVHRILGTKLANRFVVNSSAGKKDLIEQFGMDRSKIKVIYNAVEIDHNADFASDVRGKLLIPQNKFVILNVGRLEAGKNQMMLLRVLNLLRMRGVKNIGVAFIGEGQDYAMLRQFTQNSGLSNDVYFLGNVPNAYRIFNAFDLMCHCSIGEGMPNVIVEAAVMGLPIISTEVNGLSDLVIHGRTGYCVPPGDDAMMAEHIMQLYSDAPLRRIIALASRQHILSDKFSVSKMVGEFVSIFG